MNKPPSFDVHAEVRRRLRALAAAAPSSDVATLISYYLGTQKAYDQAAHALLRALR